MKKKLYRTKRPKHRIELCWRCHQELARLLRLRVRSEQYRNLSHLVEDYLAAMVGIVTKKPKFDIQREAMYLGSGKSLSMKLNSWLHVYIDGKVYTKLLTLAEKRGMEVPTLARLFLRDALSLRFRYIHPEAQKFARRRILIGATLRKGKSPDLWPLLRLFFIKPLEGVVS